MKCHVLVTIVLLAGLLAGCSDQKKTAGPASVQPTDTTQPTNVPTEKTSKRLSLSPLIVQASLNYLQIPEEQKSPPITDKDLIKITTEICKSELIDWDVLSSQAKTLNLYRVEGEQFVRFATVEAPPVFQWIAPASGLNSIVGRPKAYWFKIRLPDGQKAFVNSDEVVQLRPHAALRTTTDILYEAPDEGSKQVEVLNYPSIFWIKEESLQQDPSVVWIRGVTAAGNAGFLKRSALIPIGLNGRANQYSSEPFPDYLVEEPMTLYDSVPQNCIEPGWYQSGSYGELELPWSQIPRSENPHPLTILTAGTTVHLNGVFATPFSHDSLPEQFIWVKLFTDKGEAGYTPIRGLRFNTPNGAVGLENNEVFMTFGPIIWIKVSDGPQWLWVAPLVPSFSGRSQYARVKPFVTPEESIIIEMNRINVSVNRVTGEATWLSDESGTDISE